MRRSICTGRPFGKVAEPDSDPLAPFAKRTRGRIVVVDAGRRFAGYRENLGRREIGDAEQEPERVDELAPTEAARPFRVGPGRRRRAEHRALGLLHRLAGEQVLERIGHLQDDMLDPADAGDELAGLFHPRPEIPAIGDDDLAARLFGERHQRPGIGGARGQRLLDEDMAALRQRGLGMLEMEDVRRGDDDAVHRYRIEHLAIVLEAKGDAEGLLHLGELGLAQAVHRHDLAIGRAPCSTGMWLTTAHQPAPMTPIRALPFIRSLPSPRGSNDARSAMEISIALQAASGSRAVKAAITSWFAKDRFKTTGVSEAMRRYSVPTTSKGMGDAKEKPVAARFHDRPVELRSETR